MLLLRGILIRVAYFELLGDANLINTEKEEYLKVTKQDIIRLSNEIFTEENCSELYYKASDDGLAVG